MRVALVGCGLAAGQHIRAIKTYDGARVVGVADLDQNRLNRFAEEHGISACFNNFEDMVDKAKPEVVHIVTPPPTHAAIATRVLELGCGVLVEKPMCMEEAEAKMIIEAAESSQKPLCVMHNHLYDPPILKAERLINSVPGNDPYLVKITYFVERNKLEEEGDLNPQHWINSLPLGVYGEHGAPHVLYLLLNWVKKASDVGVSEMRFNDWEKGASRLWNVTLTSDHCMGIMTLGDHTTIGQFVVEIFTPLMVIRLNMLDLTWSIYRERNLGRTAGRMLGSVEESCWRLWNSAKNVALIATGQLKRRPGHRGFIHAYYDSLKNGNSPPASAAEGQEVVRVLKIIEDSLKTRSSVN
jgi:predicted dehydrogenase